MKTVNGIVRTLIIAGFISMASTGYTQNVGINATGSTPNASAMLDVSATDKGILIPRVALTAANASAPITSPATSLLVYNTATAGSAPNQVYPGFYFWNGSAWLALQSASSTNGGWSVNGNTGTNAASNYVGTTDAVDLVMKTSATERMRITSAGRVGIGTSSPQASLDVNGQVKLGTAGTVLNNLIKTNVSITDNTAFNYTSTRTVTATVTGAALNASVIVNPRTALNTGIGIAWVRVSAANTVMIGFTNADATSRSIGTVVLDITLIQ